MARCGFAVIEEDDQPESDSEDVCLRNRGSDLGKTVAEGNNSKGKGKINDTVTVVRRDDARRASPVTRSQENLRPTQLVGEGSSKVNAAAGKFNGKLLYRLYFKGLVSDETGKGKGKMTDVVAGFGVAICDQWDNLLFKMKGPLIDRGTNRQGAEIMALNLGLSEALKLGIKNIAICCDSYPIFQFV